MKLKMLLVLTVLLVLFLTACNDNSRVYNSASVSKLFEDANLHLIPQAEDNYPTIIGVKPKVYELIDDTLYIYVFESEKERIEASDVLNTKKIFNALSYVYQLNNVLIIYITQSDPDESFNNQIKTIISTAQNN